MPIPLSSWRGQREQEPSHVAAHGMRHALRGRTPFRHGNSVAARDGSGPSSKRTRLKASLAAHDRCGARARASAPSGCKFCFLFAIAEPWVRLDDHTSNLMQKLSAGLQELQAFSPSHHVVILLAGVVNRSRIAGHRRNSCIRTPTRLFFLSVCIKLLEEGDDVVDLLLDLEAWKHHLGVRDLYLRRLDVVPEGELIPQDARVLVSG